jgi:aspartyl-tRNA(Asn)/glutamyl-tRNA(Gln) amidotransferase subunit B
MRISIGYIVNLRTLKMPVEDYQAVIGLEIHAQLQTKSKAFCPDATEYGMMPNTQVSPISLGHPGTLPKHNKSAVEYAVMMGLALDCDIREHNQYARKNYFYADLPKGYQITQDKTPICTNGAVDIITDGVKKRISLTRIHMEEDSGKSMHDQDIYDTLVDYNRAGTPLIEIVTEPEIRSGDEAYQFITEVRKLVRYLGICDGNMEEGSLRCDANISIMKKGTEVFGTKVEVKNMNSMSNVKRAIQFEIKRQADLLDQGETFISETRGFNPLDGSTFSMRAKEMANDYRYFPEPDLPPLIISDDWKNEIQSKMPMLPKAVSKKLREEMKLPEYDVEVISEDKQIAEYFLRIAEHTNNYKAAANWVMGSIKSYLNENAIPIERFEISPKAIAELILLIDDGKLSNSSAAQNVFPALAKNPNKDVLSLAQELNVIQTSDTDFIGGLIEAAFNKFPDKVEAYKNGKTNLLGLFVGEVMRGSQGKADPKVVNEEIRKRLD